MISSARVLKAKSSGSGFKIVPFILLLALAVVAVSCSKNVPSKKDVQGQDQGTSGQEVILYFADSQAQYLVPEKRKVKSSDKIEDLAQAVVEALIEGPTRKDLEITVPKGTRLYWVKVKDGEAEVNFSEELRTKHWGGSAGEIMTVYSVVDSLTELAGIKSVRFLIEGKPTETLAGHLDLSKSVSRDESLILR